MELYKNGMNFSEIGRALGVSKDTVRSSINREIARRAMEAQQTATKTTINTLIVSDLHYPFNRPNIVDEVRPFAGVDRLLISEENDFHGISRFQKLYRKSPMQELIGTRQLLIDIMEAVRPKETIVIKSNHPARLGAHLSRTLDPEMLRFSPATSSEYMIEDGFTDYDHEQHQKVRYPALNERFNIKYVNEWYVRFGHAVYCHPDAYRSPIMGTAEIVGKYFLDAFRDIDLVAVAHTHHAGFYPYGSVTLYETGCCCQPCNYNLPDAKRPWSFALMLVKQDAEGNNLINETRHIMLEKPVRRLPEAGERSVA